MNNLGRKTKTLKEGEANLGGDHIREGLSAIISVKVPEPEFEGQTKTRLGNPEVRKILDSVITKVQPVLALRQCLIITWETLFKSMLLEVAIAQTNIVMQGVTETLEVDTATLGKILGKAVSAWRAAEAAKKARELVRRKSVLTKSTLPGKLADCTTSDKAASEIFIVEGDSAGGDSLGLARKMHWMV